MTDFEAALRQVCHAEAAPADLREGLLAAARSQDRVRTARRARRSVQFGLAAALVVMLGSGAAWLKVRTETGSASMAQAALSDFMAIHQLDFEGEPAHRPGSDPCACWSKGCVGFEAALPKSCARLEVSGGRGCRLKGVKAACYHLQDGRSLYVFAHPIEGAGPSRGQALARAANYQAHAWNEDGRGYVMVTLRP